MNETGTSEEVEELLDYFSRLPESVVHHILSILPFKAVVRCSVLSKTWNRIWSNYPNIALVLSDDIIPYQQYHGRQLLDSIEGILEQCLFRKACIQKLLLSISFVSSDLEEFAPNMDRWLGAAIERNVSELVLDLTHFSLDALDIFYSIPERVVVAHSLKVLDVAQCKFEDRFTCCIELSHLQTLKLHDCQFVGENVLNKILSGCPVLEFLDVIDHGGGSGSLISISRNPRLKYFCIEGGTQLKRIEIYSAPSLETFKCMPGKGNPCAIDLDTCTALKHLYLKEAYLSAHHLPIHNLLSKLVCIESLELYDCEAADQIKISSACLKRLVLSYFSSFPGAIMDLPNLLDLNLDVFRECSIHRDGYGRGCNIILHEKLFAVPFSSVNEFLIEAMPNSIVISSMREEYLLTRVLYTGIFPARLSLIFSSRQSIELVYKNLIKAHPEWRFQLVSTQEIECGMDSAWKSFINALSTGYHTTTIIIEEGTGF
nr:putative F-box/LRR-repeat protein At4g15060 [Ipomoea batatas]